MVKRDRLVRYLDELLDNSQIQDASVNGLQVEGSAGVGRVALATDAALSVYEKAVNNGCQMLVVHHGLIWNGIRRVTGRDLEHIRFLLEHDLNLYASHLPLDMHPRVGNNAGLADIAGVKDRRPFGEYHGLYLGFSGELEEPVSTENLVSAFTDEIGGSPVLLPFGPDLNSTAGIVSGGGSSCLKEAIDKKLDCYITGEGDHANYHVALESGINVIYLGHYESETTGVKALGRVIRDEFGLETCFIDEPTLI